MSAQKLTIIIHGDESRRADLVVLEKLRESFPSLSRAALKGSFKAGKILFNHRPLEPSFLIPPGTHHMELLDLNLNELSKIHARPSPRGAFLPVIYEDVDLLVLHKTSGVPSVPHSPEETETAVGAALAKAPELVGVGGNPLEPGLLHRLDTGTSGLLVFAKTQKEFDRLRALWQDRKIRKIYRAISQKSPESEALPSRPPLTIDLSLAHDAKSSKKMFALTPNSRTPYRGKPLPALTLLTEWRPFADDRVDFTIEIKTGVMHQIRCHLAARGYAILGDPLYRGQPSSRLWLHAWKLEIPLATGATLALEAALPEGWPIESILP